MADPNFRAMNFNQNRASDISAPDHGYFIIRMEPEVTESLTDPMPAFDIPHDRLIAVFEFFQRGNHFCTPFSNSL